MDDRIKKEETIKTGHYVILFLVIIVMVFLFRLFGGAVVVGESMENTFHDGESLLLNRYAYTMHEPEKNDVVVITGNSDAYKDSGYGYIIKRVIATEGDELEIVDGQTYVNGKAITEDYARLDKTNLELTLVPKDSVFVMGDNRAHSLDSRKAGFIKDKELIGKIWINK
jgi:signal peptidase I